MDADTTIETAGRLIKHGTYGKVTPDGSMAILEYGKQFHVVASCYLCVWWSGRGDVHKRECKRSAPSGNGWYRTKADDSCGEFSHDGRMA